MENNASSFTDTLFILSLFLMFFIYHGYTYKYKKYDLEIQKVKRTSRVIWINFEGAYEMYFENKYNKSYF